MRIALASPLVVTLHHDRVSELLEVYRRCGVATYVAMSRASASGGGAHGPKVELLQHARGRG
jgi:hypothetical protein